MNALDIAVLDTATRFYAVGLSTKGLQQWLVENLLVLLVLAVGFSATFNALTGKASAVFTVIGLSMFSLGMIGMAVAPGAAVEVSKFVAGLVGIGGGA